MEENKDKELDIFIKKLVKEIGSEEPPINFTEAVLSQIRLDDEKNALVYRPLISKSTWGILAALVVGICAYVIFGNPVSENGLSAMAKLNQLTAFNLSVKIPDLSISNTFVYGFLILALFTGIQVFILKDHFDKRYSV